MINNEQYIKQCPVEMCNPKGLDRQYQHLCGRDNCNVRRAYFQGRTELKKEYEDIVIGLTNEEVRRIKQDTRLETIDECIAKIKEEWSYYNDTCNEICNELERMKKQK